MHDYLRVCLHVHLLSDFIFTLHCSLEAVVGHLGPWTVLLMDSAALSLFDRCCTFRVSFIFTTPVVELWISLSLRILDRIEIAISMKLKK